MNRQLKTDLQIAAELQVTIDRVSAELSAINESNLVNLVVDHKNSDLSREVVSMKEIRK